MFCRLPETAASGTESRDPAEIDVLMAVVAAALRGRVPSAYRRETFGTAAGNPLSA
jgi:hypothetical protein